MQSTMEQGSHGGDGTIDGRPPKGLTRGAILAVATEVFAERGYQKASLSLVAERLNVTRQAFYYHFQSKSAILAALFDHAMTMLETKAANSKEKPDEPRFVTLLAGHLSIVVGNADLTKILVHERPAIAAIDGLDAGVRRVRYSRQFSAAYREAVDAGLMRQGDSRVIVNGVLAAANAVSSWWRPSDGPSENEVVSEMLALLTRGLLVEAS